MFIGRYQPFHDGHKKLIETVLNEGKNALIAVRDTPISRSNPYTYEEPDNPDLIVRTHNDTEQKCMFDIFFEIERRIEKCRR